MEFMQHGSFSIRISEVSHFVKEDTQGKTITVIMKDGNSYMMKYAEDDEWGWERDFNNLVFSTQSHKFEWGDFVHPFIKGLQRLANQNHDTERQVKALTKEINILRKLIKSKGIT